MFTSALQHKSPSDSSAAAHTGTALVSGPVSVDGLQDPGALQGSVSAVYQHSAHSRCASGCFCSHGVRSSCQTVWFGLYQQKINEQTHVDS